MNKQQIVEILIENQTLEMLIPDSKWVIMQDKFEVIADEILALNSIWSNYITSGQGELETYNNRKITHRPGGFTIEVEHEEECGCRQCKPELWFQDERDVWCHKVQSFGDDVI